MTWGSRQDPKHNSVTTNSGAWVPEAAFLDPKFKNPWWRIRGIGPWSFWFQIWMEEQVYGWCHRSTDQNGLARSVLRASVVVPAASVVRPVLRAGYGKSEVVALSTNNGKLTNV